jgi:ADP-ribose pyrophosphatase
MVEFPAGKKDAGESSLACAERELREETGYRAREWSFAGRLAPSVAYTDEIIDIWFARGMIAGARELDVDEHLDVFTATPEELMAWSRSGAIIDCKTLIGVLWLQNVLGGAWTLDWSSAVATPAHAAR